MSHTSLTVELISTADLTAKLQQDDILMAVNFSDETKIDLEEPRLIFVGLNGLGNSGSIEIWRGYGKVTCHQKGRISYCHNNDFLFGHLLIDEMDSNNQHLFLIYFDFGIIFLVSIRLRMELNVTRHFVLGGIKQQTCTLISNDHSLLQVLLGQMFQDC
jgi:hypothetical protein